MRDFIKHTYSRKWDSLSFYDTDDILLAAVSQEDILFQGRFPQCLDTLGEWELTFVGQDLQRYFNSPQCEEKVTAMYIYPWKSPLEKDIKTILNFISNKESTSERWRCDTITTYCPRCERPVQVVFNSLESGFHIKGNGCSIAPCSPTDWWDEMFYPVQEEQVNFSHARIY